MRPSRPPEPPPAPPKNAAFGPFTLIERLAVGGMAEVFRALEPQTAGEPRAVVVKRMLPHIAAEPDAARMFEEEARLGSRVEHPNVVRVLGSGEAESQPYLALELVPGLDLRRLMRWLEDTRSALEPELALFVACELLAGLEAVHEARDADGRELGIVHGDVTPSNVLLSSFGDVKLADFGIAEARLRSSFPQAAAAGRTKGKLGYLAPEQVRGEPSDRRADVFAAAVVATELLIGEPLFARGTELAILLAVRDARADPLLERRDRLPDGLCDVLLRGLARAPGDRFESAAALREALAPFAESVPAIARKTLGGVVGEALGAGPRDEPSTPTQDVTLEPPLDDYVVERAGGDTLGPMSFAQLVEAVTMGRVGPADRVRIGADPPRPLGEVAELAGHFPEATTQERPEVAPNDHRPMAGGGIVDALARSAAARAQGVWICERGELRKEIFLVDGAPEFVSSNLAGELLGEFLVARGILERGELEMALAVLPRFEGRLGDTLAALGLVEPVQLFRHIAAQVREKLLELFTWEDGTASFFDGVGPPRSYFPLGLDPWRMLQEGVERRLAQGLEQETFAPHIVDELVRTAEAAPDGLPREVEEVLAELGVPRSLQDVVEALEDPTERDVHRPYRAIRLALAIGLVRFRSPGGEGVA
ncbi:MAG TPA: serine/threonine-protein kinase [Sandaracinaceae bacterium LLY-WYZ-13_1]|nr:serine/threonine-protein kinase [Sandaracinaceae bacterium LLY-WYZ-13_1]